MSNFFVNVQAQPVDGNGDVLAGAKVYFYDVGTTDERDVYTDAAKTTLHTQPVVADADGRFPAIYFQDGDYKYILTDASDVQIGSPQDNVPGPNTTTSSSGGSSETPVTVLTGATTLDTDDYGKHFELNATGGAFTVILPSAVDSNGKKIHFNKADSANSVTLTGASSQTINGATTLVLDTVGDFANTTANGANHVAEVKDDGTDSVSITDLDDTVTGYLKNVGEVYIWPHDTLPAGSLEADGASYLRTEYSELFAVYGTRYGAADSTHFNVPDYRDMFLRGQNSGRSDAFADPDVVSRAAQTATGASADTGDNVGTTQTDALASHDHTGAFNQRTGGNNGAGPHQIGDNNADTGATGGSETRPNNVSVKFIIFASAALASGASGSILNRLISGSGTPSGSLGIDGDVYLDISTTPFTLYGPKASGSWGTGYALGSIWRGAWALSTNFSVGDASAHDGGSYYCTTAHISDADKEPGTGASWTSYWDIMAAKGSDGAPGTNGTNGTDGADGADGTIGPSGVSIGISWNFSNTITAADPGSGNLRLNHASYASVTEIYVDDLDINGIDVSTWIASWFASTSPVKSVLEIVDPSNPTTNYAFFDVTAGLDSSGYFTLTVANGTGAGTLPDSAEIKVGWRNTGNVGASGSGSGDMTAATYDPGAVNGDAFSMANMSETASAKVFSSSERTKLTGVETGATADQTNAEIETAYNAQVGVVSQAAAEAGTSTTAERWTPQRVGQAIAALAVSGGASVGDVQYLAIQIADLKGSSLELDDGIADPFDSEDDVDTATSTNETYVSALDYYRNRPNGTSESDTDSGLTSTSGWSGFFVASRNFALDNDATVESLGVYLDTADSGAKLKIVERVSAGSYDVKVDEAINHAGGGWQDVTLSTPYVVPSSGDFYVGVYMSVSGPQDYENGGARSAAVIDPTGTGVSLTENTDNIPVRAGYMGSVADMTLVSDAFTADAVPTSGYVQAHIKPVDTITINTDVIAEVSRDGGTTWGAATLVALETLSDGTVIYEDTAIDVSGQPSGTSMKWRLRTLNTKEINFTAIVFKWG